MTAGRRRHKLELTDPEVAALLMFMKLGMDAYRAGAHDENAARLDRLPHEYFASLASKLNKMTALANVEELEELVPRGRA